MSDNPTEEADEKVFSLAHETEDDFINSFDASDAMDTWREKFSM